MTGDRHVSRRDFLRLRRSERGKVLEVSCRAMFMRFADAANAAAPADDCDPSMGEPPAVLHRRTPAELTASLERDLADVQVLRLLEPEWLEHIEGGARINGAIAGFRARGGIVETSPAPDVAG